MDAIDVIKRRLKEERVPDAPDPDEIGEKKKRPREVAFMDVNLCFPCGKCPEFCPVQCIEYLAPDSVPGRGVQPVQDRFQECIGCYICVEVCALLTDYDAVRMYGVDLVEEALGVKIGDRKPDEYVPAEPYEESLLRGRRVSSPRERLAHPREDDRGRARDPERGALNARGKPREARQGLSAGSSKASTILRSFSKARPTVTV